MEREQDIGRPSIDGRGSKLDLFGLPRSRVFIVCCGWVEMLVIYIQSTFANGQCPSAFIVGGRVDPEIGRSPMAIWYYLAMSV